MLSQTLANRYYSSLLSGIGLGYGFNKTVAISLDLEKTEIADISTQSLGLTVFLRF
ncbi:hypothetical protein PULV_b0126 [Pseudoalteromonas ulvae UL12]|nr:hypothetical protein [Pseudoalteromonas ulvae UL12]